MKTIQPTSFRPERIKPLPFLQSLPLFADPALLCFLFLRGLYPRMTAAGVSQVLSFYLCMFLPLGLLLLPSLLLLRLEQGPLNRALIVQRFSLKKLRDSDWLWIAAGVLAGFLAKGLFGFTLDILARVPGFGVPDSFPAVLKPGSPQDRLIMSSFLDYPLKGAWWFPLMHLITVFLFNVLGEEFWWRGYIWPRQEKAFGRNTWWIHGILWTLFHAGIAPWRLLEQIPSCLFSSWIRQKTGSTTVFILIHLLGNCIVLVPLITGVIGI